MVDRCGWRGIGLFDAPWERPKSSSGLVSAGMMMMMATDPKTKY